MLPFPVRTLTLGIADAHPLSSATIQQARTILLSASKRFNDAGYAVQTLRLSTRPLFDDLADWSPEALLQYVKDLQGMLDDAGLDFC